jgi:hypothetical protein
MPGASRQQGQGQGQGQGQVSGRTSCAIRGARGGGIGRRSPPGFREE